MLFELGKLRHGQRSHWTAVGEVGMEAGACLATWDLLFFATVTAAPVPPGRSKSPPSPRDRFRLSANSGRQRCLRQLHVFEVSFAPVQTCSCPLG